MRDSIAAGSTSTRVRRAFRVAGVVQGVGFRPFVYVTATALGLSGEVSNDSTGVLVEVEGDPGAVAEMASALHRNAPPLAVVEQVSTWDLPLCGGTGFRIATSQQADGARTLASPDIATCADCRAEMMDPANRRYRHPFVTCTNCGPRFTIITDLPYDRVNTTMAHFPMCAPCTAEYADPRDRRFHAQPISCRDCGPRLTLTGPDGVIVRGDDAAIAETRVLLAAGRILAIKGVGGYHLVCDATNESAVATLRQRKRRGDKPFAVMVADDAGARRLVDCTAVEAVLLNSPARPIVLLPRRPGAEVAASVAPGNPDLGILLPYTPVHALLFGLPGDPSGPAVLVMTSGNLSGEPIITDDAVAAELLAPIVDGWLAHDRPIHVPCDDSVSRMVDGEMLPIRRSRGYAPLPLTLPISIEPTLAVGADLKNVCCVGQGDHAWMSQHIGDMDDMRSLDTLGRTVDDLTMLTGVDPGAIAADKHPGYRSVDWARRNAAGRDVRGIQHHHAHICSVMAENGITAEERVIGIAFDGTGYGSDGAVWGGEMLLAGYPSFRRLGHLAYVPLPGGDAAVERPYRMALSHLRSAGMEWDRALAPVAECGPDELTLLDHQLKSGFGCVPTSSMGRLFDAVSAITGVRQVVDYEGQAAIELEGVSRPHFDAAAEDPERYRFSLASPLSGPTAVEQSAVIADPAAVIRAVATDTLAGVDPGLIGARFHHAVIALVVDLAVAARKRTQVQTVALSGGVFQNAILLSGCCTELRQHQFGVLRHTHVPPNDGGLALGQLVSSAQRTN